MGSDTGDHADLGEPGRHPRFAFAEARVNGLVGELGCLIGVDVGDVLAPRQPEVTTIAMSTGTWQCTGHAAANAIASLRVLRGSSTDAAPQLARAPWRRRRPTTPGRRHTRPRSVVPALDVGSPPLTAASADAAVRADRLSQEPGPKTTAAAVMIVSFVIPVVEDGHGSLVLTGEPIVGQVKVDPGG